MSWSYVGPASSAKDQVRFLIGDTTGTPVSMQILSDEEIEWLLSQYNDSPIQAAIRACETVIAKFSRMSDETVGSISIRFSQRAQGYRDLIADLKTRIATEDCTPYAGGISKSDKQTQEMNTDRVDPDFKKHMMENQDISPWVTDPGKMDGDFDD